MPAAAPLALPHVQVASGTFALPASKSLANRALVIRALSPTPLTLHNTGDAEDVVTMQRLLGEVSDGATLDCGPAGTTFRFLTAYLTTQHGTQTLTGSARMLQRPIGALVDALRQLGARIDYLGEEGFPPLSIGHTSASHSNSVTIAGDVSSQYLSALMLIAPSFEHATRIEWTGELVSRPYLEMTAALMRQCGAEVSIEDPHIDISAQPYTGGVFSVESDWSGASYPAAWCALAPLGTEIACPGLRSDSLQGDRQLTKWAAQWGVETRFDKAGATFVKTQDLTPATFEADFETSPDLAQTFSALCAATGTTALFSGLQTLSIKETDRVKALQTELAKTGVFLTKLPPRFSPDNPDAQYYMQEGKASWEGTLSVSTYHDHRMAMALSVLATRGAVEVEDPKVVGKSFPHYWDSLAQVTAMAG